MSSLSCEDGFHVVADQLVKRGQPALIEVTTYRPIDVCPIRDNVYDVIVLHVG